MKKIKSPFLTTHFSESGKNAKKRIGSILNTKPKKIGAAAICFVLLFAAVAGGTVAVKKIETGINAVTDTENVTYFGNINIDELYQTRTPYAGNHIADGKVISALKIFDTFGASTTSLQTAAEPYGITLDFRDPVSGELSLETEACAMLALIENLHYVEWKYTNALGETQRTRFTAEDASERLGADVKSFGESRIKLLEMFMINSGCREDMEYLKNLDSTPEEAVVLENGQIVQEGRSPEFLNRENSTKKYSEDRLIVIDKNGSEEKRTIIHLRDGVYSGAYYTLNHSTHCEKYGTVGRWGSIISQKYDGRTQCMLLPINPWMSIAYTVFEEGDYYADTIDSAVGDAVIRNNEGKYLSCEFKAEGHVILDSVTTEKNSEIVYAVVSYGEYAFMNNMFIKDSGSGAIPVVMEFSKEGDKYILESYQAPKDGSYYTDSIKEMFPKKLQKKALNSDKYYNELAKQEYSQAYDYLKSIGRNAVVGSYRDLNPLLPTMNVEASNKLIDIDKYGQFQYPIYIGTYEKIIDGKRFVLERKWDGDIDGGVMEFITTAEDGTVVEHLIYNVEGENVTLRQKPIPTARN